MSFAPDRERLVIHTLAVHRGGQVIDVRPRQEVRVLNREEHMERFKFDGRLLAVCLLDNIHPGDTIEVAYSLESIQPPLFGRLGGRFIVRAGFAAQEVRCRLVYHPDRAIYSQAAKPEWTPQTAYTPEGLVECQWVVRDVKPMVHVAGFRPPFQAIDYSEFATWEEVAAAASPLFAQVLEPLPEHLATWVEQVRQAAASPEDFLLQVIRYVQERIRYVAVSIDEHTVKPYDILTILERHYGDCKDKSILLCRLLRGAGFDALPVLVNSYRGGIATNGVAQPLAFDHAIVRLKLGEEIHWIDGTISHQGGRIGKLWHPDYGKALVLCAPGLALETVPPSAVVRHEFCSEFIKVNPHGGTAELRLTLVFTGPAADDMRHAISDKGEAAIESRSLTVYREMYPEVKVHGPRSFTDDREENKITIVQNFLLSRIWNRLKQTRHGPAMNQAFFPVLGIRRFLHAPAQGHRSHSYRLEHPVSVGAMLDVRLPAGLQPHRNSGKIESPGFTAIYQMQASSSQGKVDIKYQSHKPSLKPAELDRHIKAVEKLAGLAGVNFSMPEMFVQRGHAAPRRPGRP
jgi:transglutaminase-like putative cysteine protease